MNTKLLQIAIIFLMINSVTAKTENSFSKNTLDPFATMTGDATICPNNNATLSISGTPNSLVTIVASNFTNYVSTISASGTSTFITPNLQETTTYSITNIREFATNINTPITDVSVTITVIPNGCSSINIAIENDNALICNVGECINLSANLTPVPSTSSYEVSSIPYCPQAAFENGWWTQLFPGQISGDDQWSSPFNFPTSSANIPNFNFCFFGNIYNSINVGTNGVITFNSQVAQSFCPWSFSTTIPNLNFPIKNAIYGVYQDTNYDIQPPTPFSLTTNYAIVGAYPCRKFIVNFTNLPQYQCNNSVGLQTSQIVLYEGSNIIEIYINKRTPCTTWQFGRGLVGIQNDSGTLAYSPPGRNTGNWSATNEAWRFTPNGPQIPYTFQWLEDGVPISSELSIDVCPTETKTYVANANYDLCGNNLVVNSSDLVVLVVDNQFENPIDLSVCYNAENNYSVDLTQNASIILGNLNPNNFDVLFFNTEEDANNSSNAIVNPENYSFTENQLIFVNTFDVSFGCSNIVSFELIILDEVTPPSGESVQSYVEGQTLNDLVISGENINWYDAAQEGNLLSGSTLTQNNTTYYATQTVNSCESRMVASQRFAVLVTTNLDTNDFNLNSIKIYPNPFNDFITIENNNFKSRMEIFSILGQKISDYNLVYGNNTINLNSFTSGVYFFKITAENKSKTFKLIKK